MKRAAWCASPTSGDITPAVVDTGLVEVGADDQLAGAPMPAAEVALWLPSAAGEVGLLVVVPIAGCCVASRPPAGADLAGTGVNASAAAVPLPRSGGTAALNSRVAATPTDVSVSARAAVRRGIRNQLEYRQGF